MCERGFKEIPTSEGGDAIQVEDRRSWTLKGAMGFSSAKPSSFSFLRFCSFLSSFLQRNGLHFRLRLWPRLVLRFPQRWNRILALSNFSPFLFVFVWFFFPPDLLKRLFFGISQLWCAYFFPLALLVCCCTLYISVFFFIYRKVQYSFWFPVFPLVTWSILDQASSPSGLAWPFAGHLFFLLAIFRRVLLEFSWCVLSLFSSEFLASDRRCLRWCMTFSGPLWLREYCSLRLLFV